MVMLATLRRSGGLDALARKLNVQPPVAALGAAALLPMIVGSLRRFFEKSGGGTQGLADLTARLGISGGGDMAVAVMLPQAAEAGIGTSLLQDVAGEPRIITAIAAHGCAETGLDPKIIDALLPLLTMLVGGYLAARMAAAVASGQSALVELASLLELDRQPNPLDTLQDNRQNGKIP